MVDQLDKLKAIIARKKREDPEGYHTAERRGDLLHYLKNDLRRANIDPSVLSSLQDTQHNSTVVNDIDTFVEAASFHLDETFFEPYYESKVTADNLGIADAMAQFRACKRMIQPLKRIKVGAAIGSVAFMGLALASIARGRLPYAILQGVVAADLIKISYNSYTKRYCSLYLNMIGGTASNVASTLFQFAKTAMGIAHPAEDPLVRLQTEILWENIIQGTVSFLIFQKIQEALKK
mmetsp:Transcript_32733/g.55188  ORF Transcript_32733/g.55188 Transcript_32733/m.55188 type:complete len:235 (+) Transcript_32733:40-744(+)|eukprot:CAMPEP_0174963164 /NCGR_PEP_ID=MMETSP0004_2-20121128/5168_1 /TAXON_ID=420556 /ORGANISM="Ochromonas sp., Strain CCMP1393" /LENGTH=234 /DNA_ID=CAMNT_0016211739 /DNA_START=32 /DNA_END=736 /DNA_ORIENTATION=-